MHVVTQIHYGQAALDRWRTEHRKTDPEPGQLVSVQLLPEGVTEDDLARSERDRAAAEIAAMRRRHRQT